MAKITIEKAEKSAKQNIGSAVEDLRQVNSLLADSISKNEVRMLENNEKIETLQNEQEQIKMVNDASMKAIKENEAVIAKLVEHM